MAGFEPTRAEPIGFQVQRLNHSATTAGNASFLLARTLTKMEMRGIEPRAFHMQSERSTTELHPLLGVGAAKIVAPGEARTHGLQIMRLTRCLLRYGGILITWGKFMVKKIVTHGGTRTPNFRFRRPTPYPLGHAGRPVNQAE